MQGLTKGALQKQDLFVLSIRGVELFAIKEKVSTMELSHFLSGQPSDSFFQMHLDAGFSIGAEDMLSDISTNLTKI